MDERDASRNRRIWAAIFSAVALGVLAYGVARGEWPTISATALVAVINIVGAIHLLRNRK
jgi:hypothetical protein